MSPYTTTSTAAEQTQFFGFGLFDKKGREIGARVYTCTEERVPATSGLCCKITEGAAFVFRIHHTRNGKSFGSSSVWGAFRTTAERDARIKKYLADAKKRAAKTAA